MRRALGLFVLFAATCGGAALTAVVLRGQTPPPPAPPRELPDDISRPPKPFDGPVKPAVAVGERPADPALAAKKRATAPADKFKNVERLPHLTQTTFLAARRGAEWLHRMNQPNGRFVPGFVPALNVGLEGDSFLRQATAAHGLARAARFTGEEKYAVRAAHSALALLAETTNEADGRTTPEPSVVCNKVAAAALLSLTICEIPDADADLLARGEELCKFLKSRWRDDGSVRCTDAAEVDEAVDADFAGPAVYALIASNRAKPAAWKTEAVAKAATFYRKQLRGKYHAALAGWLASACAETFAQTKQEAYAECALEMAEAVAGKQLDPVDPKRFAWRGGYADPAGKPTDGPALVPTAHAVRAMADACGALRNMAKPDAERYDRLREKLVRSCQFLTTVQYADDTTQHFASEYRQYLVGGFHPSQQDGTLRSSDTGLAVTALIGFLTTAAEMP